MLGNMRSYKVWDEVAYVLELPMELASFHSLFHVSMLKKCLCYPTPILHVYGLGVDEDFPMRSYLLRFRSSR